ncbi:MAG: phosphatidate cytidylyltransferase [Planctomycetes bacterium]|nr:phosphatidate cytidylyltransferase [Planctomycetota bacterium]
MRTRVIAGVLIAVGFLALCGLDYRRGGFPWGISCLFVVGIWAGMREYLRLQNAGGAKLPVEFAAALAAALAVAVILEFWKARPLGPADMPIGEVLLLGIMVVFMCAEVIRGEPERFRDLAVLFFGFFYIWVLGTYSMKIRHLPAIGEAAFLWWIVASKGTDAMAYFTGKAIGKHKLIPKVSPGKTIEGSVGGLVLGCAMGLVVWKISPALQRELPLAWFIPVSLLVQVVGQFGDLVESLMKRSVAMKDSAKLLPGMGGVLDVIDCLLLSAPVAYTALVLAIKLRAHS